MLLYDIFTLSSINLYKCINKEKVMSFPVSSGNTYSSPSNSSLNEVRENLQVSKDILEVTLSKFEELKVLSDDLKSLSEQLDRTN
jgi:hypothetical protein